ncbi:hypothetical protein GGE16_003363 [Rhizobium leguminosarum]|uniref:Uncharacterized protein n=1 Tax=Rhizobium leguminosarum TaxID=384 RepID=A0AAE2MLW7_RHILE|nr:MULTISPECIES: hypothetical protein [Rhizobium]MBB4291304.1 hypothetical protein [Rhizobium leguminosarum]MBB4297601.1 hypothetical protein [Rhizobium leguminosarum]MBB4308741.1 hypothetical protein [Rhizobium leguminosarum]MBB4416576.1 hypothetical protein [Rhizobium leguminosarum]MBB4430456.1 hypothetical protein [Rhizobium esperanzae]
MGRKGGSPAAGLCALPMTCTGRAEMMGKPMTPEFHYRPDRPAAFWQSFPKRFRLGCAAGFRGLRNAVPFCRIKAKKIPIVQPNLTFSPPKIH